jgi:hypothetical protein
MCGIHIKGLLKSRKGGGSSSEGVSLAIRKLLHGLKSGELSGTMQMVSAYVVAEYSTQDVAGSLVMAARNDVVNPYVRRTLWMSMSKHLRPADLVAVMRYDYAYPSGDEECLNLVSAFQCIVDSYIAHGTDGNIVVGVAKSALATPAANKWAVLAQVGMIRRIPKTLVAALRPQLNRLAESADDRISSAAKEVLQ